jgi:hypothetical protein
MFLEKPLHFLRFTEKVYHQSQRLEQLPLTTRWREESADGEMGKGGDRKMGNG